MWWFIAFLVAHILGIIEIITSLPLPERGFLVLFTGREPDKLRSVTTREYAGNITGLAPRDSRANNLGQVTFPSTVSAGSAGRVRIFEVEEVGDEDTSGRSIARVTASIAELDKVMAEFDRSEPEDR